MATTINLHGATAHTEEWEHSCIYGPHCSMRRKKLMLQRLRTAQRLQAMARWIAGAAHDFKNIATAIRLYSDLLQATPTTAEQRRYIEEIHSASERGASLVQTMLGFSRRDGKDAKPVRVADLLSGMRDMLERLVGENGAVHFTIETPAVAVRIAPIHLEEAVLNCVVNARDAMAAGGTVELKLDTVELNMAAARKLGVRPGCYARLAIADTGRGMTRNERARAFEPFFTTKTNGMGLGLSTVRAVVEEAGGTTTLASRLKNGTTVTILLPSAAMRKSGGRRKTATATANN